MIDYITKRPMLLCGAAGSLICIIGFGSRNLAVVAGALLIITAAVLAVKKRAVPALSVLVMLLITVSLLFRLNAVIEMSGYSGSTAEGTFIITDTPKYEGDYCSATVEAVGKGDIKAGTRIFVFYSKANIRCGDAIRAEIRLENLSGSPYRLNSYSNGVYLSGNMSNIETDSGNNDIILSSIGRVREYITDALFCNLGYSEAATLDALVQGDKSYLTPEFEENIRAAGVSHVMVVSGMHLAIIVSLITGLIDKVLYNRYLRALVIFLTVVFMTLLCGFTKSILRAGITYILYAVSVLLKRDNNPENTLGAAVALILAVNPFAIFSISFQLSVLSTFGILAVALPVIRYLKNKAIIKGRLMTGAVSVAIVSLAALIFTLPVCVRYFGYISVVSVITNLLISAATTAALSTVALALVVGIASPLLARPLYLMSGLLTKYINIVIDKLGALPFATADAGMNTAFLSVTLIVFILAALLACKKRNDMIKLKAINAKLLREGGRRLKWQ